MQKTTSPHEQFLKKLRILSVVTRFDADASVIDYYDERLSRYNYADLIRITDKFIDSSKSFPRIADFEDELGIIQPRKLSDEDLANAMVNNIIQKMISIGGYRSEAAKEALSPTEWAVVENHGGWKNLCMMEEVNLTTHKAQMRGTGIAILKAQSQGKTLRGAVLSSLDERRQPINDALKLLTQKTEMPV